MQGGVEEGERLDAEAAKHLLRRAGQMLRPYRRQCIVALVMVVVWTGTTLAGPFLVKYGIDQGIKADDPGALNAAVVGYVVVAGISYVAYRFQVLLISRIGESFLRDLRLRVFDHLQRLSMPFYDREKAGIIVSRMTSDVDSLQELVQMGLLMFVSNGLLLGRRASRYRGPEEAGRRFKSGSPASSAGRQGSACQSQRDDDRSRPPEHGSRGRGGKSKTGCEEGPER
jgi:hypothetical protein